MKRSIMLLTVGLMAGCASDATKPAADAAKPVDTVATPAPTVAYPSHEGEPTGLYFESRKDGKTYVTAYVITANLIRDGQIPPYMVEKAGFSPDGEAVVFEDDGKGLEKRLEKDYLAQHKK
jgi:hypothetical protein